MAGKSKGLVLCNSRFWGSDTLFSPPRAPGKHVVYIHIFRESTHTHKIKIILFGFRKGEFPEVCFSVDEA